MNELEKDVLHIIGENVSSPDVFTDSNIGQIRDSINDAIEEISMITGSYKERYSIPLYQEQAFYRLRFSRGSFGFVVSAWLRGTKRYLEQTDLIKLQIINPRFLHNSGRPLEYLQVGIGTIGVVPKPGSSSDVLELECVVIPERYAADDERIKLRDNFKRAVISYAASEYYASRGDAKEAKMHFIDYVGHIPYLKNYRESQEKFERFSTK